LKKSTYSVKDIADMAGVSVATVSRVINQNGRFSEETEARVREVIRKTNFQPNQLARGLRTNETKTIGILVPDITNEFFVQIIAEMQKCFFEEGYITIIFNTNEDEKVEKLQMNAFRSQQVSGMIYVSGNTKARVNVQVPTVYIDREPVLKKGEVADYVLIESDNFQGGVLATEELIGKGCKNIACVCFNEALSTHGGRVGAYRTTLKKHEMREEPDNLIKVHSVNFEESRSKVTELLSKRPEIDGIFCTTDILAIGAIKAADDLGLKIPEQLKIVGFDDTSVSEYAVPPLTTVRQSVEEIGKLAVELMIELIHNQPISKRHFQVPIELVVRSST